MKPGNYILYIVENTYDQRLSNCDWYSFVTMLEAYGYNNWLTVEGGSLLLAIDENDLLSILEEDENGAVLDAGNVHFRPVNDHSDDSNCIPWYAIKDWFFQVGAGLYSEHQRFNKRHEKWLLENNTLSDFYDEYEVCFPFAAVEKYCDGCWVKEGGE